MNVKESYLFYFMWLVLNNFEVGKMILMFYIKVVFIDVFWLWYVVMVLFIVFLGS